MKPLTDLKPVCAQCRQRDFELFLFARQDEIDAFQRGLNAASKPSF
jgi:hypothetical protein